MRYDGDRLTAYATGAPLTRVLDRVARATGAEIRGDVPTRNVSVALDGVPLTDALTAILRDQSFMLTYASDGSLRTIDLLAAGGASPGLPPSTGTTPAASASTPPRALLEEERQAAVLQRPVTVSPEIAAALGSDTPPVGALLHAALGDERASVRAASREAILQTFAADRVVEAAYLSTLVPVADATLAAMLQRMARNAAAEELLTTLAARAPSDELRRKAASVLRELQKLPPL